MSKCCESPKFVHLRPYHARDHFFEGDGVFPAQDAFDFAGVAAGGEGLDGGDEVPAEADMVFPIQADGNEGFFDEVLDGVEFAGGEDVVVDRVALENHPHAAGVVGSPTPVAHASEGAECEFGLAAFFDVGDGAGDFHGHEVSAAAWGLVVVEDGRAGLEFVGDAVDARHLLGERFGRAIGRGGVDRRVLVLWRVRGRTENFAAGGVEEARRIRDVADDFQQAESRHTDAVDRVFGKFEADARARLAGEVVELGGLRFADNAAQVGRVFEGTVV